MSRIDDLLAEEGARAEAYPGGPAPEHVTTSRPNLGRAFHDVPGFVPANSEQAGTSQDIGLE